MNQHDRLKAFETDRDALNREFLQGLIEPATLELLTRRLSEKYIQLARAEEVGK